MMTRCLLLTALAAVSLTGQAEVSLDRAEVRWMMKNGRAVTNEVGLVRQPDGAWRLQIRTIDIGPDVAEIEVENLVQRRRVGDAGWWMLNDGRWGAYTRTDGAPIKTPLRIAMFGGKLAEGEAWCAIVKGLRLECQELPP